MPEVGEYKIVTKWKQGDMQRNRHSLWFWVECPSCGMARWVGNRKGINKHSESYYVQCKPCSLRTEQFRQKQSLANSGKNHWKWNGGRTQRADGYIEIWLEPDDFYHAMAYKGRKSRKHYVLEHRLVMAKHLGRCLFPWEIVHHKNGIKDDNRIENLELLPDKRFHLVDTLTKSHIKKLEHEIRILKKENKRLNELPDRS